MSTKKLQLLENIFPSNFQEGQVLSTDVNGNKLWVDMPTIPVHSVNDKTGAVNLTASDVGALPDTTTIPSKTSELTNDSGFLTAIPDEYVTETELSAKSYLTSYTETDPTVPDWAKQSTKPTYTADEVGALPSDTVIPSIDGLATETYVDNAVAGINAVPTSTATDNGKVLSIIDGIPTWATIDSVITIQKYYTGTDDPDSSTGADGDLYLKTT